MDEQLAAIYGTGQQYVEEDIEKTAAAELLVKLAEEEGVDLDNFSDEEIAGMIGELYGEGGEGGEGTEIHDEGEEKVAEADMLGRVMAHAMVQELGEIEKEAGARMDAVKGGAKKAWEATRDYHRRGASQIGEGVRGGVKEGPSQPMSKWERAKMVGKGAARFAPHAAAAGTAAALAGGGGGKKTKKASAIDKLAEARAYEMLMEAGYVEEPQEKVASDLDYAVEARALEMLEANGYPVEWNE